MKMKTWKILAFAGIALAMSSVAATAQRNCGSMDVLELQLEEDPKRAFMMDQIETHLLNIENTGVREVNGVVNIPVVVHVIYNNSTENISDAQVLSQINVLMRIFAGPIPMRMIPGRKPRNRKLNFAWQLRIH
jgi:hypothetical protein